MMSKLARRIGAARYEADGYCRRAVEAYERGNAREGLEQIAQAIALLPNHAAYHAMRGWFHSVDGDIESARAGFARALALDAYDMLANYGCGRLAYGEKDWEAAEGYFLDALAAQPERPETRYYLGLVRHRRGDNRQAREWMESAGAGFRQAGDEREGRCRKWVREFDNLLVDGRA